jgi:hypothetical protein
MLWSPQCWHLNSFLSIIGLKLAAESHKGHVAGFGIFDSHTTEIGAAKSTMLATAERV